MEFRILGPLEVSCDGSPVPIKGRHQPRILAVLLLEAGRTVTVSRLIEALWDGEPPDTARRQVQNYMAALRRTLSAAAADPIEVVGEGFRLATVDDHVDSLRFETLVARAREDTRAGRHAEALACLDEALGLWRGPALADLTGRILDSAAYRLNEARLEAIEDRAEAWLDLGRPAGAVAELREVVADNPIRQRAARQLMLALYRGGGVTEALDVFTQLRARLADELGIDPGPQVRQLHERILREDSSLDVSEVGADTVLTVPEFPIPAQLPADVATFTGREVEQAELDKLLGTGSGVAVVAAISGGGGVGKTALAVHWARKRRDRFPDGQLYINLRGFDHGEPVSPIEALSRFLRALGIPGPDIPTDPDEAAVLCRSILDRRRTLVLLDNAETADQVRPLLPGGDETLTLITSRNRLMGLVAFDDAKLVDLEVLTSQESLDLLSGLIGAERLFGDIPAARRLAALCGHLPLALRVAAAKLASDTELSVSESADELDSATRLERFAISDGSGSAVTATFDLSFNALEKRAQLLFLQLASIPGEDFPEALAGAVAGEDAGVASDLMRQLENASLLEVHENGRRRFHDLVHFYAKYRAEQVLDNTDIAKLHGRIADWYDNNRNNIDAQEEPNVIAICDALKGHPQLWQVAAVLFQFAVGGRSTQVVRRYSEIALRVAEANESSEGQARILPILTVLYGMAGEVESGFAVSRRLVDLLHSHPELDGDGVGRTNLALFYYWQGYFRDAEVLLHEALRPSALGDNPLRELRRVSTLGSVYRAMGKFEEAHRYFRRGIALIGRVPVDSATATMETAFATLITELGRYSEAVEYVDRALNRARANRWRRHEAIALKQRGVIELRLGNVAAARSLLRDSIDIAKQAAATSTLRETLLCLAELESDDGDQQSALDCVESSTCGDGARGRVEVAEAIRVRCKVFARRGELSKAVEYGVRATEAYGMMRYPLCQARSLVALADAYDGLGDTVKAEESRAEALTIFTRLGVPDAERLRIHLDARPRLSRRASPCVVVSTVCVRPACPAGCVSGCARWRPRRGSVSPRTDP